MLSILSSPLAIACYSAVVSLVLAHIFYRHKKFFRFLRPDRAILEQDQTNSRLREEIEDWVRRNKTLETRCKELEEELERTRREREQLRARVHEVEENYISLAETNQRQQGQIDRLQHQVEEALEIKRELAAFMESLKGNVRPQA